MATNEQPYGEGKPFGKMSFVEKVVFLVKVVVFLASFGFAFPRVLSD